MSTNIVILDGNLTRDPETGELPSGMSVAKLRLAVQRPKKDGEDQGADFFDVSAFAGQADVCARYLKKGRRVLVEGRMRHREWQTDDGQTRQAVDVVARSVQFLDRKQDDTATNSGEASEPAVAAAA